MKLPIKAVALVLLTFAALTREANVAAENPTRIVQTGLASWYGGFHQGRPTASGEIFDMNNMTAAHRTLPFGTWVKVTSNKTGKSVLVRINDRGPNKRLKGRVIDLSRAAAYELGFIKEGLIQVTVEILGKEQ